MPYFRKILIANRSEIAVRIIRACKEMGIKTVSVYSDSDVNEPFVTQSDGSFHIGKSQAKDSYLNYKKIIRIAKRANCQAIHPGYGFLSENANFASEVEKAGLVFIGPNPNSIEKMGDKIYARRMGEKLGVPIIPGVSKKLKKGKEDTKKIAKKIGYPVLIKAAFGGGGKGMRVVEDEKKLESSLREAQGEARSSFGNATVFIEKYLTSPRHIEIQILGDNHGNYVHLGGRECSIQRRHQKLIEETPSVFINESIRKKMGKAAIAIAKETGYNNAGTVEFLMDKDKNFYFLEMNTRLQVEHPVTELVTGIDLVKEQIKIAAGEKLGFKQKDIHFKGAALECRIYAEDPFNNFIPQSGIVEGLLTPHGPHVRNDSGISAGSNVTMYYDPLIAKLIVWGKDRKEAIKRMERALKEYKIVGLQTTIPFNIQVMTDENFNAGEFDANYIDKRFLRSTALKQHKKVATIIGAILEYQKKKREKPIFNNVKSNHWQLTYRMQMGQSYEFSNRTWR